MDKEAELIWETYNEGVLIEEGIREKIRNTAAGIAMAGVMAGSEPNASGQESEPPPIEQLEFGDLKKSVGAASDSVSTLNKHQQNKNENYYRLLRMQDDALGEITPYPSQKYKANGEQEVAKLFDIINYLAQHSKGSKSDVDYVKKKVADSSLGQWRDSQGKLEILQDQAVYIYKQLVNQRL